MSEELTLLSNQELSDINGGGFAGFVSGLGIGALVGVFVGVGLGIAVAFDGGGVEQTGRVLVGSMLAGAAVGGAIGTFAPTP